jgi:hypothetical protein
LYFGDIVRPVLAVTPSGACIIANIFKKKTNMRKTLIAGSYVLLFASYQQHFEPERW